MEGFVLNSPPQSAEKNMQEDLSSLEKGDERLLLRFLQWDNKAITLGSNEKPERSLQLDYVREKNIQVAKRPTGGRAVYHHSNDSEITFSLVCPRQNPFFKDNLASAFQWVSALVVTSLPVGTVTSQGEKPQGSDNTCFDSLSRYEISCRGHKVFGSAQKRSKTHLLVQSTLLLHCHKEFNRILRTEKELKGVCDFFPDISKESIVEGIKREFLSKL